MERGLGKQGHELVFFSEGGIQSSIFVFRMLCNILEWDVGVFRDLV